MISNYESKFNYRYKWLLESGNDVRLTKEEFEKLKKKWLDISEAALEFIERDLEYEESTMKEVYLKKRNDSENKSIKDAVVGLGYTLYSLEYLKIIKRYVEQVIKDIRSYSYEEYRSKTGREFEDLVRKNLMNEKNIVDTAVDEILQKVNKMLVGTEDTLELVNLNLVNPNDETLPALYVQVVINGQIKYLTGVSEKRGAVKTNEPGKWRIKREIVVEELRKEIASVVKTRISKHFEKISEIVSKYVFTQEDSTSNETESDSEKKESSSKGIFSAPK